MINLTIKKSNEVIECKYGINIINIEDVHIYRNIYYNLEDNILASKDNNEISFKYIGIIKNPLELDLNDKKNLSLLYKNIICENSDNIIQKRMDFEKALYDLIDELIDESNIDIEYDEGVEYPKVLALVGVRYKETSHDKYLEYLIRYIKIIVEFLGYGYLITFGLSNVLDKEEFYKLKEEMEVFQFYIIDFTLNNQKKSDLTIIEDWCII